MYKIFSKEKAIFNGKHTLFIIAIVLLATIIFTNMLPADVSRYGAFSLAPAIFLIIYIFVTKRILEALILSSLIGFIMVSRPETMGSGTSWLSNTFSNFSDGLLGVMMDEDIAWPVSYTHLDVYKRQPIRSAPNAMLFAPSTKASAISPDFIP